MSAQPEEQPPPFVDPSADPRALRERLLGAFQLSDRVQVILDAERRILLWNHAAERLYGFTAAEVTGRMLQEALGSVYPDSFDAAFAELQERGRWTGMVLHTAKSGESRLVRSYAALQRAPDGAPETIHVFHELADSAVTPYATVPAVRVPAATLAVLGAYRDPSGTVTAVRLRHGAGAASFPLMPPDLRPDESITDLFPDFAGTELFGLIHEVLDTGEPADFDSLVFHPSWVGTRYLISGRIVRFGDGVAIRAEDVTAAREAEQSAQQAQQRFQLVLDAAPVVLMQCDRDLVIEWGTGRAGTAPVNLFAGERVGIGLSETGARDLAAACRAVIADGKERSVEVETETDGSPRFYQAQISPRIDGERGGITGATIVATDISRYRESESAFSRAREMLRVVLDNTPDLIWLKGLDGRYLFANAAAAQFLGMAPSDLVGRMAHEIAHWPADLRAQDEADDRATLDVGRPHVVERIIPVFGEARRFLLRRFPIRDEHGTITAIGGVGVDLTSPSEAGTGGRGTV